MCPDDIKTVHDTDPKSLGLFLLGSEIMGDGKRTVARGVLKAYAGLCPLSVNSKAVLLGARFT